MKFFKIVIFVVALLLPATGFAAGLWDQFPGVAGSIFDTDENCKPNEVTSVCYYDMVEADATTHVTPILDMRTCENLSIAWISDITNDTLHNNTIACHELMCATIDADEDCATRLNDAVLDGNPAATDTSAIRGTDAGFVYCDRVSTFTSATTGRIRVSCFPRQ